MLGGRRAQAREGASDIGIIDASQALAGGPPCWDPGEAALHVAAVFVDMQTDHRLDPGTLLKVEVAEGNEVLGQRPSLVTGPGLKRGDRLNLIDQAVLQG